MAEEDSEADIISQGSRVRNDLFDPTVNFDRGASKFTFALWYMLKIMFFTTRIPWPMKFKIFLLRRFGAKIGEALYLKPRVDIYFPWKLSVGDHTWFGEGVTILNFEPVTIGSHCCISQNAYICCGNHDFRSVDMRYRNAPITIEDGVWLAANSTVLPGVSIGYDSVISAGCVVSGLISSNSVVSSTSKCSVGRRWK